MPNTIATPEQAGAAQPDAVVDSDLRNYAVHAQVFEQVSALQGQIGGLLNLYMLATGAVWAVLAPNVFNLPTTVVGAGLILHIVLSATVLFAVMGMANAAHHRLEFAQELGRQCWKSIETVGERVNERVHTGVYRPFTLRQRWIYMVVPVIGILGSVAVGWDALRLSAQRRAACESRRVQLVQAADRVALDRAKYLLDKAGCDLKTKP
jgi:hypothetical protein